MGHNRYATHGKITDRNAHPFGFRIRNMWHFGVHNGCINNTKELSTLFNIKSKPFVDSEIFFWALANLQNSGLSTLDSFKEVIKATSKHSDFAVAYMETEEKALYLIRSHTRPLITQVSQTPLKKLETDRLNCEAIRRILFRNLSPILFTVFIAVSIDFENISHA